MRLCAVSADLICDLHLFLMLVLGWSGAAGSTKKLNSTAAFGSEGYIQGPGRGSMHTEETISVVVSPA